MATYIEYSLMSANVYGNYPDSGAANPVRSRINTLPVPDGWTQLDEGSGYKPNDRSTGFMGSVYVRGNEVVISYAGTTDENALDWLTGNLPAGSGLPDTTNLTGPVVATQVVQAAELYMRVLNDPQFAGRSISFTGHSLGGGLASLMAVYFDRPAVVFDEAFFVKSADSAAVVNSLRTALIGRGYALPAALANYQTDTAALSYVSNTWSPSTTRLARQTRIQNIAIRGEVLSVLSESALNNAGIASIPMILGAAASAPLVGTLLAALGGASGVVAALAGFGVGKINNGANIEFDLNVRSNLGWGWGLDSAGVAGDPVALHSISLLTGLLLSRDFENALKTHPELIARLFASEHYKNDPKNAETLNLLDVLVTGQYRGRQALDVLAGDVVRVNLNAGLTSLDFFETDGRRIVNVAAALLDVVLAGMYQQRGGQGVFRSVLRSEGNAVVVDTADLGDQYDRGIDGLNTLLNFMLRADLPRLALNSVPGARWAIQTGSSGLAYVAAVDGKSDIVIGSMETSDVAHGGDGNDTLIGSSGNDTLSGGGDLDFLYGGEGADSLDGGGNADWLSGGAGHDTYRFVADWGRDTIEDSDGQGALQIDGFANGLPQGKRIGEGLYESVNGQVRYTLARITAARTDLIITFADRPDQITIRNWTNGQLGITFDEVPVPPSTSFVGDQDADPNDNLTGSVGADSLSGLVGNDVLNGLEGGDVIQGGIGMDFITGGLGADVIDGGAGNDVILGSGPGTNIIWGTEPRTSWFAITSGGAQYIPGYPSAPIEGDAGNVIDGGDGEDWIAAGTGNDVVRGGNDGDGLFGMAGDDFLDGGAGADLITGDSDTRQGFLNQTPESQQGNDTLVGDAGDDTMRGNGGDDELFGGADNDELEGDTTEQALPGGLHGNDYLDGESGNDQLTGQGGADTLFGGIGDDTLLGDTASETPDGQLSAQFHGGDYLDGESGADRLYGGGAADELFGGTGNDTLMGDDDVTRLAGTAHGDDYLDGEEGQDRLVGQGGADTLFGGADADSLWGDSDTSAANAAVFGDDYLDGEDGDDYLEGGGGADTLFGSAGNDSLWGDADETTLDASSHGDDHLAGDEGDDEINGGGGSDVLEGGDDDDILRGDDIQDVVPAELHGSDSLFGGAGDDYLYGDGGDDALDGGEGNDWIAGEDEDSGDAAVASELTGDDVLAGGEGDDTLLGGNGDDTLDGGLDNDTLRGGSGDDELVGGDGNDWLAGGNEDTSTTTWAQSGNDTLMGGSGADTAVGGEGNDLVDGGEGADVLFGGGGDDSLTGGTEADLLDGGAGDDDLEGDGGADSLSGGDGNDELDGGTDADVLFGDAGNDTLRGGDGADWLSGDDQDNSEAIPSLTGNDSLEGGAGADSMLGGNGQDTLRGDAGNDVLDGGEGDDVLEGGTGVDEMRGGAGNDIYVLSIDDMLIVNNIADTIYDTSGDNTLQLAATLEQVELISLTGANLGLFVGQEHGVILRDALIGGIEHFTLNNGVSLTAAQLIGRSLQDVVSRETAIAGGRLYGGAVEDDLTIGATATGATVSGGRGNDQLTLSSIGGATVLFEAGDGADVLNQTYGSNAQRTGTNALQLGANLASSDVRLVAHGGNAFSLRIGGQADSIAFTLDAQDPTGATRPFDELRFTNGEVVTWAQLVAWGIEQPPANPSGQTLIGGTGNDTLNGGAGADTLSGGAGSDQLLGHGGSDSIVGSAGNDVLGGDDQTNPAVASSITGNDTLRGGAGLDRLVGGNGHDVLDGGSDGDQLYGGAGNDLLQGGDANDFLTGEDHDYVTLQQANGSMTGDDTLEGGNGDDFLISNYGRDSLDGGEGNDRLFAGNDNDTLHGQAGDDVLYGENGNDSLLGGAGADSLRGDAGTDTLLGGEGNDTVWAGSGDDLLDGGSGHDLLYGDSGNDTFLRSDGFDRMYGGNGADVYHVGRRAWVSIQADAPGSMDRVILDPTISPSNVVMRQDSNLQDLVVRFNGREGDELRISGFFATSYRDNVRLEFGDGTIWSTSDIQSRMSLQTLAVSTDEFGSSMVTTDGSYDLKLAGVHGSNAGLTVTGTYDARLRGDDGNNLLVGNAGNNIFNGLSFARYDASMPLSDMLDETIDWPDRNGQDTLVGGAGDDIYFVGIPGSPSYSPYQYPQTAHHDDVIVEMAGEGTDTVVTFAYHTTLADNVENLFVRNDTAWTQINNVYGSTPIVHSYVGNAGANIIDASHAEGFAASLMVLDGAGGADTLIGRALMADTYLVDNVADVVVDSGGVISPPSFGLLPTHNTVVSSVSYELGDGIQELVLRQSDGLLVGTGNDQSNILRSVYGVAYQVDTTPVILDANSGDTLIGLAGDDVYYIDAGDVVVEEANGGIDTVIVHAGSDDVISLANFQNFERIGALTFGTLIGSIGDDVITGGKYSNGIQGGAGNDVLIDTREKLGVYEQSTDWRTLDSDTLHGGAGEDTIRVTLGHDHVYGGEGDDTIEIRQSNPTYGQSGGGLLYGAIPSATVHLGRGEGHDTVQFVDVPAGHRRLQLRFESSIDVTDLTVHRVGNDLTIALRDGDESVTVRNALLQDGSSDVSIDLSFVDGDYFGFYGASALQDFITRRLQVGNTNIVDSSDNLLVGTNGGDVLSGADGSDTILGGHGNDSLSGDLGSDSLWGGHGDDLLIAGDGGAQGYSRKLLDGGVGHDTLVGGDTDDTLRGGAGNDVLFGGISGSQGDLLDGGLGDDRYVIVSGANYARIADEGGTDRIEFGAGIEASNMRVVGGSYAPTLALESLDGSLFVSIDGGLSTDDSVYIESVHFADGTVWTYEQMRLMATRIEGTSSNDSLLGGELDETLFGYAGNDTLEGGSGNDTLDGGAGSDSLVGGYGDDVYFVDSAGDVIVEDVDAGVDLVQTLVSRSLGVNQENMTLLGSGNINATGNSLANVLSGNAGSNTLNGGSGADTMAAGASNDTYVVDNPSDVVIELTGEGTDLVQSSITYSLAENVENLTLTGSSANSGTGNASANSLVGNSGANTLSGNAGNDTLNGGTGTDTLIGGTGDDTYVVDATTDVVTEATGEGIDLVQSSVTYTLAANVENLTLTGTSAINGTGNTLNNVLTGNSANNNLSGGAGNDTINGGTGNDTMVGGTGDDTYVVNISTDVVTEAANEGTDTVQSAVTLTLGSNVENLTLTGTSTINGTGNTLNNVLIGNSANNNLNGGTGNDTLDGGLGNDTLVGGAGNDTFVVNVSTDVITENASEGTDTVQSTVAWTLSTNLENLTLIGTSAVNGTGNASANVLTGNAQANTLSGLGGTDTLDGGAGNDILDGGVAADTYLFGRGWGTDTVRDNDSTANVRDRIQFGAGIVQGDMRYSRVGNNLEALIFGTTDKIVVQDWYLGSQYRVEDFRFADGSILTDSQVHGLVGAMATFSAASAGETGGRTATRGTPVVDLLAPTML